MSGGHPEVSPHAAEAATAAQRRADALRRAAQAKREAATARGEAAIRQLIKNQREINFRSVAHAAGVSLDFLYASPGLRARIEGLRAQQAAAAPASSASANPADTPGSIAHALTTRVREERAARRAAVGDLEQRLAAAHGEILRLHRLLQQHGIQA